MRKLLICSILFAFGCGDDTAPDTPAPTGTLHAALAFAGSTHDVVAMRYRVVAQGAECDDPEAIAEAISPLEDEALPLWLSGAGDNHAFADALFVLQPGTYRVCVTPIQADGEPSAICDPVDGEFEVVAEQTTEGVLYSQCAGDPSGGLDVIAALNNPPHIDDLGIEPSKFITTCEEALITVTASDPDGDPLNYDWQVLEAPPEANPVLVGAGPQASFGSDTEGPYLIRVTVDDGLGGETHLDFPIHVSFDECEPPCEAQCGALGASVEEACLQVIGGFPVPDPEAFCAQANQLIQLTCNQEICEQPPGDCDESCDRMAQAALAQCLAISPDPALCEQGVAFAFAQCQEIFRCPPPPLPCDAQCFEDANAQLGACLEAGADPLICPESPDPNLQTCLVQAQGALNACVWGPEGCFPPEQRSCEQECSVAGGEQVVACLEEPSCGNPNACGIEAQAEEQGCQMSCCFEACIDETCSPRCGGDVECLQECARNECDPLCNPEPPCEQGCGEAANQAIADCLNNPPQQPICPQPDNDCVARGFDVFAECAEARCQIDTCPVRCTQACIEDCNDVVACQQDPALTAECQAGCAPPEPPPEPEPLP